MEFIIIQIYSLFLIQVYMFLNHLMLLFKGGRDMCRGGGSFFGG